MTKATLKEEIHRMVDEAENEKSLQKAKLLLEQLFKPEKVDFWDEFSPEQKERINAAREQVAKDGGTPHSVVKERMKKRYNL